MKKNKNIENGQSASNLPYIKEAGSTTILCCEGVDYRLKLPLVEMVESENTIYYYVLCEPNTYNIRYVGITKNPLKRFYRYLYDINYKVSKTFITGRRKNKPIKRNDLKVYDFVISDKI